MVDGVIRIKIDVDGKELELTNKDLDKVEKSSHKAGAGIKKFAASLGLVAIGAVAFNTLKNSMDNAINRFDTLNKFPKVLQSLGVSAEDSDRAMRKLADGIDGLPTQLNDIALTAQRMYTSFGDIDKATDTALALNNALLGSGSSAEQAKRGTEMYIKALQTGKIDMDTWNTLSETMDVGLVKIAESFGFAGRSAKDDLYKALKDGTITLDEFNDALIEVGTGTGIMAKLARENTLGIATSFENLKTAAVRGLVEIIDAFNELSKEVTGKEIAQNIDSLKRVVFTSFQAMAKVIRATTPVVVLFANGVEMAIPVVKALTPAIVGLMTAYGAYVVITKASTAIQIANAALKTAMTTTVGASKAMSSLVVVQKASTKAAQADMLMRALQNKQITLGTLAIGLLTGKVKLATAAQMLMTATTNALAGAIRFLSGPIGWVITGIGLLTTGVIALVKWFKRTTEEGERLSESTEELSESTDNLVGSIKESENAYREQQKELEIASWKHEDLIDNVNELAKKEHLSASEKEKMNGYIRQLNESMDGLNLAYDEEAHALNMTSEELTKRIDLMRDLDGVLSVQERLNELTEEQIAIEMQLEETTKLREEWDQALKDGSVTGKEYKEAVEELINKELELKDSLAEVSEQHAETEGQVKHTMDAITQAVKDGTAQQIISLDMFSEKQRETIESMNEKWREYQDMTTDMFDTLSDEIEITASQMADNLEENQRIVSEWADNIATLAERGVDDGLLEKLREAGPESAGHVNALVNASDDELARLNDVFSEGGKVATDALAKSLGIENTEIMGAVGHLVADTGSTLRDEIANAGFDEIGIDVAKGLAEGVTSGSSEAESASKEMADNVTDATKSAFGVKSPSTVYKGIGQDLTAGLALGIGAGTGDVVKSIQNMFKKVETGTKTSFKSITKEFESSIKSIGTTLNTLPKITQQTMTQTTKALQVSARQQMNLLNRTNADYDRSIKRTQASLNKLPKIIQNSMNRMTNTMKRIANTQVSLMRKHSANLSKPYNSLPTRMNSIGRFAMAGLTAGLRAGSGAAIATARNTANQIKTTMQSALKINSPSHVMRDDVGRWIPAGVAEGIKRYSHMIDNAIDDMYNMIVPQAPELAIGANMAVNARGVGFSNEKPSTKTVTNNNTPTIHIEKIENYSEHDIPRILEESAWILSREDKRL